MGKPIFKPIMQAVMPSILDDGTSGQSLCNLYYFKSTETDSLQLGSAFTGNLKVIIAGTTNAGIEPTLLAGVVGTWQNSVDVVNAPVWNQLEVSAAALTYIVDNTFDGIVASYAKDDVWYSVNMGPVTTPPPVDGAKNLWTTDAIWRYL